MLRLFKKDRDYGQGMEFVPIGILPSLSSAALRILQDQGNLMVVPQMFLSPNLLHTEPNDTDDGAPVNKAIEYKAVYQHGVLAGAYIEECYAK